MKEIHEMHLIIGKKLSENLKNSNIIIFLDKACNKKSKTNLPLFCSSDKSNDTEYCNVDALIIKNNKIKIIIEIEESNIKPTQIFGKFMTSALSKVLINESIISEPIYIDDNAYFIQVLSSQKLKEKSKKKLQGINIEKSINDVLPIKGSNIVNYKLMYSEITSSFKELIEYINKII